MDKIEITTDYNLWQNLLGRFTMFWLHMRIRLFFAATVFFAIGVSIVITENPEYKGFIFPIVFVVLGMWISPIVSILIDVALHHKEQIKSDSHLTICLDNNGIEMEHNLTKVFLEWSRFAAFRETKKRFILITKRVVDNDIILAKRYMSDEKTDNVRKTLQSYLEMYK